MAEDLRRLDQEECFAIFSIHRLSTLEDLEALRQKAQDREAWRKGVARLIQVAYTQWVDREKAKSNDRANARAIYLFYGDLKKEYELRHLL